MARMKQLGKQLQQSMIDNNMIDRHMYKSKGLVTKHGIDKTKKTKQAYIAVTTNSGFYSEGELMASVVREEMERLNAKPVIEIDPSTVKVELKPMTPSEKAFMLARKYRHEDPSKKLKWAYLSHLKKEMNKKTIEMVMDIVASIKATKLDQPDN